MTELNKTAKFDGFLEMVPAQKALAPFVTTFVHRDEVVDGGVIRILPELRASVQLRVKDPYWIREQYPSSPWRCVPDISIWAPRHNWGYGYAATHIKVFAFDLTPTAFQVLTDKPVGSFVNCVLDANDFPMFHHEFGSLGVDCFHEWIDRTSHALLNYFEGADPTPSISTEALAILAAGNSGAITKAAEIDGISPRHFRRRFTACFGIGPKRYQRFTRVDRQLRTLHPAPWEQDPFQPAAITFADQPHTIREFQTTIGMTPLEYERRKRFADRTLRSVPEPDVEPPNSKL